VPHAKSMLFEQKKNDSQALWTAVTNIVFEVFIDANAIIAN